MIKKLIPLSIGLVLLIGLCIGLFFLNQIPEKEDGSLEITNRDYTLFSSVTVESENFDAYTIMYDAATGAFYFQMGETLPTIPSSLEYAAVNVCRLTANRDLGEQEDLSQYGLDKPQVTIHARFTDGRELNLSIGNATQGVASENYILVSTSTHVYTASIYPLLMQPQKDYLTTTILNETITDEETGELVPGALEKATISGTNYPDPIYIIQNPNHEIGADYYDFTFLINSPIYAPAGGAQISKLDSQLSYLVAVEPVLVSPKSEQLAEYGLDNPQAIVTFTTHGSEATLSAGKVKDDICYIMLSDISVVFSVLVSDISSWLDVEATDFIADEVYLPRIDLLDTVEITRSDSDSIKFQIFQNIGDEGEITFDILKNGSKVDTESFRSFFLNLTSLTRNGAEDKRPSDKGTVELTVTYTFISSLGKSPRTLTFIRNSSSDTHYVKFGDDMLYVTCAREEVLNLYTLAQKVD